MTGLHEAVSLSSTVGDQRPLSSCALSPSGVGEPAVATGSWSGVVKIWGLPQCSLKWTLRGHEERVSSVAYHPLQENVLASAAADKTARIWGVSDGPTGTQSGLLHGHVDRVAGVAFHPFAPLLATASFDSTWRLWDAATCKELLLQEGHSKPVYKVAFHPDGGLVASTGLDCGVLLWDLRSGKAIATLTGHMDQTLGLDFSPDGYHLASGGGDNSVKIWDLRRRKAEYTIPAHSKLVSSLKFQSGGGHVLLSTSYDRSCKIWSRRGWLMVRAFTAFEEKVTCGDISADGSVVVACCYDKTWKLWGSELSDEAMTL
eukprot:Plantae.Rhodophyta-Rhodochaete_pulchella.ctg6134.p1 GENE.Plantae.Rhodophyta-Rhodochaete_pulchella.ctg6134~~Plantae.Rhodophyta-Rhodochaete_pulchella.ctg6134.p1  ORF type:complete len:360 (+),score=40.26 Plantae.Rhodophyta-Rhodochaete_pulchella.ctg6134:135-1082(+)